MPFDSENYVEDQQTEQLRGQARELLIEAARLVQRGWCRGDEERYSWWSGKQYCAVGALKRARRELNAYSAFDLAKQRVDERVQREYGAYSVEVFNDNLARTKKQVVHLLRDVADAL